MADEIDLDALAGFMDAEASATPQQQQEQEQEQEQAQQDDKQDTSRRKKHKRRHDEQHRSRRRHRRRHRSNTDDKDDGEDSEASSSRHTRPRSRYVLDAAESGESGDDFIVDDDDDDGDAAAAGVEAALAARLQREQAQEQPPRRERFLFHEGDAEKTADELGREYEERVRAMRAQRAAARQRGDVAAAAAGGGGGSAHAALSRMQASSLRYAAQLLPHDTDPKVFAVKCRPRMPRLLVARLVNKCYAFRVGRNYEHKRVDLGIISVFCLDHVREYIYVEAYRKLFVENALTGLEGVFRYQIAVVDPSELMQMMERRPGLASAAAVRVGALVRLRQRGYRHDLAQVVAVQRDGRHVTCRVVPRVDYIGKPYSRATTANTTTRLPPRFFVPSLAMDAEDCGGYVRWGECRFDKEGYLLKTVSTRSLLVVGSNNSGGGAAAAAPTAEELARFYRNNRERVREAIARLNATTTTTTTIPAPSSTSGGGSHGAGAAGAATSSSASTMLTTTAAEGGGGGMTAAELRIGDTVRVIAGQLRNTVGRVVNLFTSNGTALLSCVVPGRAQPLHLRVELSACVRCFAEGTHVLVEKGTYAGESGTVIRSHGDTVLLFLDRASTATELRVRANDCHESKLVGSFSHSYHAWRLFDLVALSDMNLVACLVHLSAHDVDVLTEHNERRTLTYAQIKPVAQDGGGGGGGRGGSARKTFDRMQNILVRGAEVTIQRTPLTPFALGGQTGRIEHVYNRTLFVHCRAVRENAGIVALDADCVLLLGGRTTLRHAATAPPRELPRPQHRPHNATRADASSLYEREHDNDWQSRSEWYEPSSTA